MFRPLTEEDNKLEEQEVPISRRCILQRINTRNGYPELSVIGGIGTIISYIVALLAFITTVIFIF